MSWGRGERSWGRRRTAVSLLVGGSALLAASAFTPLVAGAVLTKGAQGSNVVTAADVTADVNGSGPVGIQTSIYPGRPGQATCNVPNELAAMAPHSLAAVKPQYLQVTASGQVSVITAARMGCNGFGPASLSTLQRSARQVLVTVAADPPGVGALLANAENRAAALGAISSFVTRHRLNGAELDFQPAGWSSVTWSAYMTFVRGLSQDLSQSGDQLEVDLPAWSATPPDAERYADPVLAGAHLVVMALDHQYVEACSPLAPYGWLRQVVGYAKSQVASSDLIVAIPSYGYRARSCTSTNTVRDNIPYVTMQATPGFPSADTDVAAHRDHASGELRWKVDQTQYDCVDATALRSKLRLLQSLGVGTVSVWALGGNPWFTGNP